MIMWNESRQLHLHKGQSMKSQGGIRKNLRHWKAALIGLLMICVATISGCASESRLPETPKVSVDASLMVEPNLTTEMLSVFSQ